jgi:DNA-binding MarR family transcriptional regulator
MDEIPRYKAIQELSQSIPEVDIDAVESYLAMLNTTNDVFSAMGAHFSRHHISRGRFSIMMQLFRNPEKGLSPAELAERAWVTRATVTGLLDGLEAAGFVQRRPDPDDRRMTRVLLTVKGRKNLDRMLPDHFHRIATLMQGLSISEKKTFVRLLHKVERGIPSVRNP